MRLNHLLAPFIFSVLLTNAALAAEKASAEETPTLKATLISEHASLAPSSTTTLAVKLEIPDKWHIYHPIVLDTGLPTLLDLTLPEGISAGELRYPSPTFESLSTGGDSGSETASTQATTSEAASAAKPKFSFGKSAPAKDTVTAAATHSEADTIDYLSYAGETVLLVELTGDATLKPGTKAHIGAYISALICEHNGRCIPIDTTATLELPITAELGAKQKAELFAAARRALPAPLADAPYLKGSTLTTQYSQLPIGVESELILTLDIDAGYHIQDRDPGVDGLIPTRVWIEPVEGLTFETDKQTWPEPKTETIEYLGTARQQAGKTVIRTPFKVSDTLFKPKQVKLHVLIGYQTCTDAGLCFPPAQAIGAVTFDVVAADASAKAWQAPAQPTPVGWEAYVTTGTADDEPFAANEPNATNTVTTTTTTTTTASNIGTNAPATGLLSLLITFGAAFLGGIVLNVMPCVLPVVSLKIFGFVNQAGEDHARVLKMGLMYAVGVLVSFLPLAIIIPLIGASWGGVIMQNPVVVILISGFVFTFGLSMVGLYEIQLPGSVASVGSVQREGYGGAFMSGLMTTILATPCTGPFLGSAVGTLATLPFLVSMIGIMLIGTGLAFPYVMLSAFPAWLKFLPKPGNWMITFKQVTGWILLAVPLWLLWNLAGFGDAKLVFGAVVFLFAVGMASFFFSQIDLRTSGAKTAGVLVTAALTMLLGWYVGPVYYGGIFAEPEVETPIVNFTSSAAETDNTSNLANEQANAPIKFDVATLYPEGAGPKLPWQEWKPGLAERLAKSGYTVYVDFTASWCLTCQTNKATVLHTNEVYDFFRENKIVPLEADFSRRNPQIQAELRKFNRNGVPLNLIYPAGKPDETVTMPEFLTQSVVLDRLKQAGPSEPNLGNETSGDTVAAR